MDGKKLQPFGDKLVLEEIKEEDGVILMGRDVQAKVVAVGPGIPYGRGEFYSPVATEGMVVIVPRKDWDEANSIQWGKEKLRVVHERQCLAGIFDG
jgi:co-chaperonin GroES (HSP10)